MSPTWKCLLLLLLLAPAACPLRLQPNSVDTASIKYINNGSYPAENGNPSGLASIFSPRMDFDQWKPLTGRGDPLRNDPTYDYEPPVLERVHYWAEETRLEREHIPERKSEVLMLGVSSRKPSVTPRHPSQPPRRHQHLRPPPTKYEDFTYKLSDHYPITILVPPPPPPPGHQPSLFILTDEKMPSTISNIKMTETPTFITKQTTTAMNHHTSSYALQEANLIYQSSTTHQNWILNKNLTNPPVINNVVSSDYAGWGPTTPIDEFDGKNETHNLISNEYIEHNRQPYSFYKPMLSEAPPPPKVTHNPLLLPTFVPTALPPLEPTEPTTNSVSQVTWPTEITTYELSTDSQDYYEEITTEKKTTTVSQPTLKPHSHVEPESNIFDMLGPMMSMPLVNGPERDEDNLYAHASENTQVYKDLLPTDIINLESMQTMLPPPLTKVIESALETQGSPYHVNSHILNSLQHKQPSMHTPDPYLHMRFTTPPVTTAASDTEKSKTTTEALTVPMYLIIQGHSKVKTYGSKQKAADDNETIINEISKHKETNEVKHLHPIKDRHVKKSDKIDFNRSSRAHNLKSLIDQGLGSIEIQEADIGIKYDVSDGSDVPVEIYRKGIVNSDENNYLLLNKTSRTKRQIDLEDLLPFDEDTIEEYVYNYFEGKKNDTSITGLIAQAVTSDAAAAIDEIDDEDDNEQEEEER